MSQDNRQQYPNQQMNRDPNNPGYQQNMNQPGKYNQYDHQNSGMNINQSNPPQMPLGQNPSNMGSGSFQHSMPQDRSQPGQMYPSQQPPSYQVYPQGQPPSQPPQPNYSNIQGYRQGGAGPGFSSQLNTNASHSQDRGQNYGSYHEASHPGGMIQNQPTMGKPQEYSHQRESNYNTPQMYRGDGGIQGGYPSSGYGENQRTPQMSGMGNVGSNSEQNINQPPQLMPSQHYGISPAGRGGMPDLGQSFQFGPDMGGQASMGNLPPTGPSSNIVNSTSDAQMDIGELNRMAEYYATNSDYPKVSYSFLIFRLLSISKK
jgi:hypothetical protein